MYNVGKMTELTGVSRRTLHYYDQIGLLCPHVVKDNGYRDYSEQDLIRLQQILLLKSLGYSLTQIAKLLGVQKMTQQEEKIAWVESLELQISWVEGLQEDLERRRYMLQTAIHAIGTSGKLQAKELRELLDSLQHREIEQGVIPPYFEKNTFTSEEEHIISRLPVMGSQDPRMAIYIELLGEIRAQMEMPPDSEPIQQLAERLWHWALQIFEGNEKLLEKYWSMLSPNSSGDSPVYGHDVKLIEYVNRMMEVWLDGKEVLLNEK